MGKCMIKFCRICKIYLLLKVKQKKYYQSNIKRQKARRLRNSLKTDKRKFKTQNQRMASCRVATRGVNRNLFRVCPYSYIVHKYTIRLQRTGCRCLQLGDKNTRYFHAMANGRKMQTGWQRCWPNNIPKSVRTKYHNSCMITSITVWVRDGWTNPPLTLGARLAQTIHKPYAA